MGASHRTSEVHIVDRFSKMSSRAVAYSGTMRDQIRALITTLRNEGAREAIAKSLEFTLRRLYFATAPDNRRMHRETLSAIFERDDVNVCLNGNTRDQYDPEATNVLIVTEGPALVEADNWLDPSFDFHAEFSYGDFYGLDNFYSLRRFHAGRDHRVRLDTSDPYDEKTDLVSIVYADKDRFSGQAMRHVVGQDFGVVDAYGSGAGPYLYDKEQALDSYMFHIAVESDRYPEYVSEKFFDVVKTNTVPIYRGGREAIRKMGFDLDGIIFFDDIEELEHILEDRVTRAEYERRRPHVEANRRRLVEIRNEMKRDLYFDYVRFASLFVSEDEQMDELGYHVRFE